MLAGRKNSGTVGGEVLVNGYPPGRALARLAGYVEQADIHASFATVGEALRFSAALRLPPSASAEQREAFCAETEALLGLAPLAGRLVGDAGAADGLAPGERKILTIAVELVSNAPILFLGVCGV